MFRPFMSGEFGFPKERRGKVFKLFVRARVIFNLIWCIIIMLQANDMRRFLSSVYNNSVVYFTSWTSSATRPSGCSARRHHSQS